MTFCVRPFLGVLLEQHQAVTSMAGCNAMLAWAVQGHSGGLGALSALHRDMACVWRGAGELIKKLAGCMPLL